MKISYINMNIFVKFFLALFFAVALPHNQRDPLKFLIPVPATPFCLDNI